jgi:hypothetical protein
LLLVYRFRGRQVFDRLRLERLTGKRPAVYEWFSVATMSAGKPRVAPSVSTGGASSITQGSATVSGQVNPNGQTTTYYFEYGTTSSYGTQTASQGAGSGTTPVSVSATLTGLSAATTYHYRLVATDCGGCRWGTAYGVDEAFTTLAATGSPPAVTTGAAGSIGSTSATVNGTVNPSGQPTTYSFEYGTTTSYGSQTASQDAGSGTSDVNVSANLTGLSTGTTYHYRLDATNASGTTYGSDQTFTTLTSTQQTDANRAIATYNAMQKYFYAANVYQGDPSSLYTETYPQSGNTYSYLWPFSRVLAGTITLSGIPSTLLGGANYQAAVNDRLVGLSRYWDVNSTPPGYDSYPPAPYGGGGDKYYDDAAWIGLDTAQEYGLSGNQTALTDAENVFNFVYPGGWGSNATFEPGGIYWVQQGVGNGATNHDRTTNSNEPNAEIALLLEQFDPANAARYDAGASNMYQWPNHYLYNVQTSPTDPNAPNPNYDPSQPALMFDKVRGDNTIDKTLYTYNQGATIAANVREYRKTGNPAYLQNAEAIANTALNYFSESYYISHSAAVQDIFFRGLLVLYSATTDTALQSRIIQTIQTYADDAWNNHTSSEGLFSTSAAPNYYYLIDQGAVLQVYAMLAWNLSDYAKLP